MFLFSSLFIIQSVCLFVCFAGWGVCLSGAMLVYPRGSCGNTISLLFGHLLVYICQIALELVSGGAGALLVSQCNMAWRSFVQAEGSGCQSFASSWWFFSAKMWLQCLSKVFDLLSSCSQLPPSSCHLVFPLLNNSCSLSCA
jgi:hypothetical protein